MIPDWQTNKVFLSKKLLTDYPKVAKRLEDKLASFDYVPEYLPNTNDIWARDYMPLQFSDEQFIEYVFDPDYLKGKKYIRQGIKTDPDAVCRAIGLETRKTGIILDGGNTVKSENSIIMTDKVFWENSKQYSDEELTQMLQNIFNPCQVIFIPWDDGCIYGHADGMLRFIDNKKVMISGFYEQVDDELKQLIVHALERANIAYECLRISEIEEEENIAYINFLHTEHFILVPSLNKPEKDQKALREISHFFKDYQIPVEQIELSEVAKKSGALNCITWTVKK